MTDKLAGTKPPTASEVWFDTYLRAHGYTWEPEPDLGIPKRPDRLIHRDGLSAVGEVKQFDKDPIGWMRETGQGGWFDENKPVRGAGGCPEPRGFSRRRSRCDGQAVR